jgi:TolB-like protein
MEAIRRLPLFAAAALALAPAATRAQDNRPVVAVLYFDNNSIGKDRADFDGLGKGIADLLITDLAGSPRMRLVERERIQKLLEEQNLTKAGAIDAQTAVRLGKILQAQYMITGGFMSTGKQMVLTARAISVESSQILNPERVQDNGDDVLALIGKMSEKLNAGLDLPAVTPPRTGDASRGEGAARVGQAGQPPPRDAATSPARASETRSAARDDAKPAPARQAAAKPVKLDVRTALLYSKALEEQDSGNRERAAELYRAVLKKFPDFGPAKKGFDRVSKQGT